MPRRKSVNRTGINRLENISVHDAWVAYICIHCLSINYVRIGQTLLRPTEAFEECVWVCKNCDFIHSKESDLPFINWDDELKDAESKPAEYFWRGFFRSATEHPESYWKQCNVCRRVLPFSAFSRHVGWGPLERQMECRACKGAINAVLNPKRTSQQLHEASVRRRIADLLLETENEPVNIEHILPSKWLYPLSRSNAALLSREANENKRDKWPSEFYTNSELIELARLTGADLSLLTSGTPVVNTGIDVNRGVARYLQVREQSNLNKRVREIKKIIRFYGLESHLNDENQRLLGFPIQQEAPSLNRGQDTDEL
jgi:hypothetical protein